MGLRSPDSRRLPSPTANTLPRRGFSLAVSGRTIPLLVLLSASTRLIRILSPSGRNLAISDAPSKKRIVGGQLSVVSCFVWAFEFSSAFGFVSDFAIRISDFPVHHCLDSGQRLS